MARELSEVGVVGLGTMGAGIAEVLARAGLSVTAVDVGADAVERGRGHVEQSTARAVARGRLADTERDEVLSRIRFSTRMADLADAELVVEAIPERMALKAQVLATLDALCPPDTILASNTSSLSVTELAVTTGRPGRVVGMHFFNPAPVMKLVEVVSTVVTEPSVVEDVEALAARLGKVGVTIGDRAGFIANALLFGYLNHAATMVQDGYAGREDVDAAMRLGCGLPMGPLALLDLIGIDTAQEILATMYRQSRNRLHASSPVITQLVTAGLLGRKTGRGFYSYAAPHSGEVVPDAQTPAPGGAAAGARPVQRVVVVGATAEAGKALLAAFPDGGLDVPVLLAERKPGGVRWTRDVDELAAADLVLVAGADEPEVAQEVFAALGERARPGAVLASTSATPPVVVCAAASGRLADVIGLHPAGRAGATGLVEVVATTVTDPGAAATGHAFCAGAGLPSISSPDRAGFVVDALLFPYLNDAVRMLEARYATADDIDAAMTLGCGYPTGPVALLDGLGLDVALAVQRALYAESREPGLAPAPLLEHLVTAGHLGRAAGRGFRDHPRR
ncbi:3-hydroxyacyl-CoA dehydrogenase family protein [Modestobacter italicus]|uniref:3-hydroxyacyl-CoA dehydrogenase family protein n=1 Tax=Modestobacter italicus (strain DSM 44449 / CECT 9708 / BC 501) TaxID=2732864 RepID=UPI00030D3AA9|nr:3-hydroxybutyryl-CoA dehydrogenase [Modestobacter marinus]